VDASSEHYSRVIDLALLANVQPLAQLDQDAVVPLSSRDIHYERFEMMQALLTVTYDLSSDGYHLRTKGVSHYRFFTSQKNKKTT
jgi:hypothetical protein